MDVGLAIKHGNDEEAMAMWRTHDDLGRAVHTLHAQLVGHVIPVFGQIRETEAGSKSKRPRPKKNEGYMTPVGDGPHPFAFRPVVIATNADISDTRPQASQGLIALQGVVVSNKMYNYPCGNERRVCTRPNPAFDETVAWVLVTHVYNDGQGIFMTNLAPPRVLKERDGGLAVADDEHRNHYESIFKWKAHIEHHLSTVCPNKSPVSSFGLADIKQTVKDMFRNIVASASIIDTQKTLRELREAGQLDHALVHVLMKVADFNSRTSRPLSSGIDIRRCLLVELLLKDTPLQPLLTADQATADQATAVQVQLPAVASVHGGAKELYRRMKAYADAAYPVAAAAAQLATEDAEQ